MENQKVEILFSFYLHSRVNELSSDSYIVRGNFLRKVQIRILERSFVQAQAYFFVVLLMVSLDVQLISLV